MENKYYVCVGLQNFTQKGILCNICFINLFLKYNFFSRKLHFTLNMFLNFKFQLLARKVARSRVRIPKPDPNPATKLKADSDPLHR
jgi:hypothetical protein